MHVTKAREILSAVRAATRRYPIVQYLYVGAFCLIYLMWNVWAARTLFYYVAIPLGLVGLNYALLRSTLRHPIFVLTTVFFAILLLTSLVAPVVIAKIVLNNLFQSLFVLLMMIITTDLIARDEDFLKTFGLFVSVAAAIGVFINAAAFYSSPAFPGGSIFATRLQGVPGFTAYYNPNVVGAIYAAACVLGASLLSSSVLSRREFMTAAAATSVLFVAVILSQSRSALIAMMAGIVVAVCLGRNRRRMAWFGLGVIVVLAALWLWTPLFGALAERGVSLRPTVWAYYWNMALERPWLGYGLSHDVTMMMPDNMNPMNAHNIILSALVRGGVLAAVILVSLVMACLYYAWNAWRDSGVVMPLVLMMSAATATTVDYEITATALGWPWLLFWVPVGICLGVAVRGRSHAVPSPVGKHA